MDDRTNPGAVANDFDAYRRVRSAGLAARDAELIKTLDGVPATGEPPLALSRALDVLVPVVWGGGEFEIGDGSEHPQRYRATASQPASPDMEAMHLPFALPGTESGFGGAGILSVWWPDRAPDEQDRAVAGLFLRSVIRLLESRQLRSSLAAAERQAAKLATDGITGRRATLAVGILMERERLAEREAEDLLRRRAREHNRTLFDEAFHVVAAAERSGAAPAPVRRLP